MSTLRVSTIFGLVSELHNGCAYHLGQGLHLPFFSNSITNTKNLEDVKTESDTVAEIQISKTAADRRLTNYWKRREKVLSIYSSEAESETQKTWDWIVGRETNFLGSNSNEQTPWCSKTGKNEDCARFEDAHQILNDMITHSYKTYKPEDSATHNKDHFRPYYKSDKEQFFSLPKRATALSPSMLVHGSHIASESDKVKQEAYASFLQLCPEDWWKVLRNKASETVEVKGKNQCEELHGKTKTGTPQTFNRKEIKYIQDLHMGWLPMSYMLSLISYVGHKTELEEVDPYMHLLPDSKKTTPLKKLPTLDSPSAKSQDANPPPSEIDFDRLMAYYFNSKRVRLLNLPEESETVSQNFNLLKKSKTQNNNLLGGVNADEQKSGSGSSTTPADLMWESLQQQIKSTIKDKKQENGKPKTHLFAFHDHLESKKSKGRFSFGLFIFEVQVFADHKSESYKSEITNLHVFVVHRGSDGVIDWTKDFKIWSRRKVFAGDVLPDTISEEIRNNLKSPEMRTHGPLVRLYQNSGTKTFVNNIFETVDNLRRKVTVAKSETRETKSENVFRVKMHHLGHSLGATYAYFSGIVGKNYKWSNTATNRNDDKITTTVSHLMGPGVLPRRFTKELFDNDLLPQNVYAVDNPEDVAPTSLKKGQLALGLRRWGYNAERFDTQWEKQNIDSDSDQDKTTNTGDKSWLSFFLQYVPFSAQFLPPYSKNETASTSSEETPGAADDVNCPSPDDNSPNLKGSPSPDNANSLNNIHSLSALSSCAELKKYSAESEKYSPSRRNEYTAFFHVQLPNPLANEETFVGKRLRLRHLQLNFSPPSPNKEGELDAEVL